jgi:hypothetical protein
MKRTNKTIASGKGLHLKQETLLHLSTRLLRDVAGGRPPETKATYCESRCLC